MPEESSVTETDIEGKIKVEEQTKQVQKKPKEGHKISKIKKKRSRKGGLLDILGGSNMNDGLNDVRTIFRELFSTLLRQNLSTILFRKNAFIFYE